MTAERTGNYPTLGNSDIDGLQSRPHPNTRLEPRPVRGFPRQRCSHIRVERIQQSCTRNLDRTLAKRGSWPCLSKCPGQAERME
jgi:hypothetical protein